MLIAQGNLACVYAELGLHEPALRMRREVYPGTLKLYGKEHPETLREGICYSSSLIDMERLDEAKKLLRRTLPVALRVLDESHELMIRMKWNYAHTLYKNPGATLDDLREAVTTLEDTERTARRVLGGAHPTTTGIAKCLPKARVALKLAQECSEIAKTLADTTLGEEETPPDRA